MTPDVRHSLTVEAETDANLADEDVNSIPNDETGRAIE